MAQEQFTVTLCDSIEDKYRFGFNGMEKDKERYWCSHKSPFDDTLIKGEGKKVSEETKDKLEADGVH